MRWTEPTLAAGMPADVVLLDLETEASVDPHAFVSKAKFSPWADEPLKGWPRATVVGGRVVYTRAP
jgi:dihydroorotase